MLFQHKDISGISNVLDLDIHLPFFNNPFHNRIIIKLFSNLSTTGFKRSRWVSKRARADGSFSDESFVKPTISVKTIAASLRVESAMTV